MTTLGTLKTIVAKLETHTEARGNPVETLKILDQLERECGGLMNIGPKKGQVVQELLRENPPKSVIELGCFYGYSAVLFGSELSDAASAKYTSFELDEDYAAISRRVVDFAGMSGKVNIIVGPAAEQLPKFWDLHKLPVDFVFIDHSKAAYVPDLQTMESLGLVAPGTVLAADNILIPGAPEYAHYVEASLEERKKLVRPDAPYPGKWNLVYKSKQVTVDSSGFVDALEISHCVEEVDA